jgi:hypothetical protein
MSRTCLAVVALTAGTLIAAGCGGSSKSSSHPASAQSSTSAAVTAPAGALTRAQLIARGNAICYRLNVRRTSITIRKRQDYEALVPALAGEELAAAVEMGKLTPPPSMAHDWQQMITGAHTIGEVTGHFRTYAEASNEKLARPFDPILTKGIDQLVGAAKHAGFKECSHFA